MKLQLTLVSLAGALVSAVPIADGGLFGGFFGGGVSDTADDWSDIIAGKKACVQKTAIFARGTFDSGNIGVWVGPQFFAELRSKVPGIALTGVDPKAYPADLNSYLSEGGSDAGATSMQESITAYTKKCPSSEIVVSGWSQGAVVAHKALQKLEQANDPALQRVSGLVTFGDPNALWNNITLPKNIPSTAFFSQCVTSPLADPLCASDTGGLNIPSAIGDFEAAIKDLPSIADGVQQTEAALALVLALPGQIAENLGAFLTALKPGNIVSFVKRLFITPQHFSYGNNGMAVAAADFASKLAIETPKQVLNIPSS